MDFYRSGGNACVIEGFWRPSGGFEGGRQPDGTPSPWSTCSTVMTDDRVHYVDEATVTRRNYAGLELMTERDGAMRDADLVYMGGAWIFITDDRPPSDAWVDGLPTGWRASGDRPGDGRRG